MIDIGCGNGGAVQWLRDMGFDATGIDPKAPDWLHRRSVYDDLSDLGKFDVVLSVEVIEHCYDSIGFVGKIHTLLKPNGTTIITTPYHGYLKNLAIAVTGKSDKHYQPLNTGGHIKFFSEITLTKLLIESGFTSVDIQRVGRIPSLAKSMIVHAT